MNKYYLIGIYLTLTVLIGMIKGCEGVSGLMFITPFIVKIVSDRKIAKELKAKELKDSEVSETKTYPPLKEVKS